LVGKPPDGTRLILSEYDSMPVKNGRIFQSSAKEWAGNIAGKTRQTAFARGYLWFISSEGDSLLGLLLLSIISVAIPITVAVAVVFKSKPFLGLIKNAANDITAVQL